MHSADLKKVEFHETTRTQAGSFMDNNIYIKLVRNSKRKV